MTHNEDKVTEKYEKFKVATLEVQNMMDNLTLNDLQVHGNEFFEFLMELKIKIIDIEKMFSNSSSRLFHKPLIIPDSELKTIQGGFTIKERVLLFLTKVKKPISVREITSMVDTGGITQTYQALRKLKDEVKINSYRDHKSGKTFWEINNDTKST